MPKTKNSLPLHNDQGIIQLIIVIFIVLALGLGVYLVQTRTNLLPKAFNSLSQPISGPVTGPGAVDTDKDGFNDTKEQFMGTDPNKICAANKTDNAWPVDTNNDTYINGADISTLVPYISGSKAYSSRYDLNQDNKITEADVSVIQPYMLRTCVPATKDGSLKFVGDLSSSTTPLGQDVTISVVVNTPNQLVNLVSAQIKFPTDKLVVKSINTSGANTFSREIESYYDNELGFISIIRGSTTGVQTTTDATIATITFGTKAAGVSYIAFDAEESQLLRVEDSDNILNTIMPTFMVTAVAPTTNPTPLPSVTSTITPSSTPQSSATPTVSSTPIVSATPLPSPEQNLPCTITSASWLNSTAPVDSNTTATLVIEATGNCTNQLVDLSVFEDDGLLGSDSTQTAPDSVMLLRNTPQTNFKATATWITEFQEDGIFGTNYPPEYKYTAQLSGSTTTIQSSGEVLQVLRSVGVPSPVEGDLNGDGKANLADISTLLLGFANPTNPSDALDVLEDGELNTGDFSRLLTILRQKGVLRTSR